MKTTKIEKLYTIVELTETEKAEINEVLTDLGFPHLEEWRGTDYGLVYNPETGWIEIWDSTQYQHELIKPEKVEIV